MVIRIRKLPEDLMVKGVGKEDRNPISRGQPNRIAPKEYNNLRIRGPYQILRL
jgi:hypothetical protein